MLKITGTPELIDIHFRLNKHFNFRLDLLQLSFYKKNFVTILSFLKWVHERSSTSSYIHNNTSITMQSFCVNQQFKFITINQWS